jgi:TonB family protein
MGLTVVLLSGAGAVGVHAQDPLDKAKSLYLEAAYEDALAVLDSSTTLTTADGHLYRALCLLALGRAAEADAAIARSIEVDPQATATRQDLSPRVAAVVAEARKRVLPDVAKRRVAEGRVLFQQGDKVGAASQFTSAVRVLDDPVLAGQSDLQDLKMLASGFLDLIRAQTPPQPAAPASAAAPSATASAAPAAAAPVATNTREPEPASRPAVVATAPGTRPLPISQVMPAWRPPDANTLRQALKGSVLVTIDPTGRVTNAVMQQVVHPAYDRLLLAAARSWRYQPATRDGQPIDSQLVVPIVLQAR